MVEWLGEWALRQRAESLGKSVSGEQFRNYRAWGLVPDPVEGRWPADVAKALVCIRRAEEEARPLERRVILLWAGWHDCPPVMAPVEKLREAMALLVRRPSIAAPIRKMRRVHEAVRAWALREADAYDPGSMSRQLWVTQRARGGPESRRFPAPSDWLSIIQLEGIDHERFKEIVSLRYYVAGLVRSFSKGKSFDLSGLPFEDVVVLLTILELARVRDEEMWRPH